MLLSVPFPIKTFPDLKRLIWQFLKQDKIFALVGEGGIVGQTIQSCIVTVSL